MKITATLHNTLDKHQVTVQTQDSIQQLEIPCKSSGYGSGINGGELLFVALATCFCNDLYREAQKRDLMVNKVSVHVSGEFAAEGQPASNISYTVEIDGAASDEELKQLVVHTDSVAEIQNTLRAGTSVTLRI